MREIIRFRGTKDDISDSRWIYGSISIRENSFGRIFTIEYEVGDYIYVQNSVIPNTVGQFTGFYDKNLREIYEGDIVKEFESDIVFTIEWDMIRGGYWMPKDFDEDYEYSISDYDLEVIGNIHDNPNLLKPTL